MSHVVVGGELPHTFLYMKFVPVFSAVVARVLGEYIMESNELLIK